MCPLHRHTCLLLLLLHQIVQEYTNRGHKQVYWYRLDSSRASPPPGLLLQQQQQKQQQKQQQQQ
jgi:hypothetical protein